MRFGTAMKAALLEDAESLADTVRQLAPDVIVNAAAYTAVDKAETESEAMAKR